MWRNSVCLFVLIVVFRNLCLIGAGHVKWSPEIWSQYGIAQPQGLAIIGRDISSCQRPQYNLGFHIQ